MTKYSSLEYNRGRKGKSRMIEIQGFLFSGHPYLDPGSGSILIQVLVAGLLGGAFIVKSYWKKIKALFTGKKDSEPTDDEQ